MLVLSRSSRHTTGSPYSPMPTSRSGTSLSITRLTTVTAVPYRFSPSSFTYSTDRPFPLAGTIREVSESDKRTQPMHTQTMEVWTHDHVFLGTDHAPERAPHEDRHRA